jgi:hypothetical protein
MSAWNWHVALVGLAISFSQRELLNYILQASSPVLLNRQVELSFGAAFTRQSRIFELDIQ